MRYCGQQLNEPYKTQLSEASEQRVFGNFADSGQREYYTGRLKHYRHPNTGGYYNIALRSLCHGTTISRILLHAAPSTRVYYVTLWRPRVGKMPFRFDTIRRWPSFTQMTPPRSARRRVYEQFAGRAPWLTCKVPGLSWVSPAQWDVAACEYVRSLLIIIFPKD